MIERGILKIYGIDPEKEESDYTVPLAVGGAAVAGAAGYALGRSKGGITTIKPSKPSKPSYTDTTRFTDPDYQLTEPEIAQAKKVKEMRQQLIKYKRKPKAQFYASGVEMHGAPSKDLKYFIKNYFGDNPAFPERKAGTAHKKQRGWPLPERFDRGRKEIRKSGMNRLIVTEALGDLSPETYHYRKKGGGPITMIQEKVKPLTDLTQADIKPVDKNIPGDAQRFNRDVVNQRAMQEGQGRNLIEQKARKKGIIVDDLHTSNIGQTKKGKFVILDPGFERADDYEKLIRKAKLSKMKKTKNIGSLYNKRLLAKYASSLAKKLPMVGGIATALATGDAAAGVMAMEPTGLIAPEEMGHAELPLEEKMKKAEYNTRKKYKLKKRRR